MSAVDVRRRAERLVSRLEEWRRNEDRGTLARLRRGLSESTRAEAWTVLGPCFGPTAIGHPVYETVAGCFAAHPVQWIPDGDAQADMRRNFGWTYRKVRLAEPKGAERMRAEDEPHTRFRRLLACSSRDEICQHVRHAVRLAKSREVDVNYRRLFEDLWWWNERTRVEWAKAYWDVPELDGFGLAGAGTPVGDEQSVTPGE